MEERLFVYVLFIPDKVSTILLITNYTSNIIYIYIHIINVITRVFFEIRTIIKYIRTYYRVGKGKK